MTLANALVQLRNAGGAIEADSGMLKLRFPPSASDGLQSALEAIRRDKSAVLAQLEATAAEALEVLNLTGTRRMPTAIGVWPDLDGPEIRAAIERMGYRLPVVHLDSTVPERFVDRDARCPSRLTAETFSAWRVRALAARKSQSRARGGNFHTGTRAREGY